jgi:hypothetical protein
LPRTTRKGAGCGWGFGLMSGVIRTSINGIQVKDKKIIIDIFQ